MPFRVPLPNLNLFPGPWGWAQFLGPLSSCWDAEQDAVVDLSGCSFLSAEGAAVLAGLVLHRRTWGGRTHVDWATATPAIRKQLGRWQLTELFGRENFPWTDNAIPLLHQNELDGEAVEGYIRACYGLSTARNGAALRSMSMPKAT